MIDPCPCKGCTERFPACSGNCPKDARGEYGYKAWKEQYDAQKKHFEANKFRFAVPMTESRDKAYSKYGNGKYTYGGSHE